jgi:hypothetical protein
MAEKSRRLTPQERTFVERVAATGDATYSARAAGYAQPQRDAWRAMQRPEVQAEIVRAEMARLTNEALPAAVGCLISIVSNGSAPAGARVQAAKVIIDRTLGDANAGNGKEPHEMTGEELARAIAELERIAADRAKDVSPAPSVDILA